MDAHAGEGPLGLRVHGEATATASSSTPIGATSIIARLLPRGYQEISRTPLIKPTSNPGNRRELGAVNWSHPAYANRHIIARNDEEIVSYSLAASPVPRLSPAGAGCCSGR